ncbi:MAG: hypothetical protein HFE63_09905 [Clostridiales bacterium]|nr:hypothetical protein [Clostridiales bacterium]
MNDIQNKIDFDVPRLKRGKVSPVSVESISLKKSADNAGNTQLCITISRQLEVPIISFTFKYRFSSLPLSELDSRHAFHSYVYTDEDMNQNLILTFNASVPSKMSMDGCTAYISEVKLTDGRILTYSPSDFLSSDEAAMELLKAKPAVIQNEIPPAPKKRKINRTKLAVILTLFFFVILAEIIVGGYLLRYSDIKNSASTLIDENRYNEAYKLVSDNNYRGLLQQVCTKASLYYSDNGDYESAYVYACGAPEPFSDTVIELAAANVVNPATGEINENAYRVAKTASNDASFHTIVRTMTDMLSEREDYLNALRVASELRTTNEREKLESSIFTNAINRYLNGHRFEELISFISRLSEVNSFKISDADIANAITSYCTSNDDTSGLIYLSTVYPELLNATDITITVKPDDPNVRAALDKLWDLLSVEQKRTYHSRPIAVYKEMFTIRNGRISGTDITDAVSVDTYEYHTIVLHRNGSVSAIPNEKHNIDETFPRTNDVIQIAAGLSHSVMLHSDGTVTAIGDNSSGQCNVNGWTDIVEIAAGQNFTLGLKIDGTVVSCGSNACGQRDLSSYRNVVSVAAGSQTSVLLFSDGTVKLQGYCALGLKDVEKLDNIVSIRAASVAVLVKLHDGSFRLYSGIDSGSFGNPNSWKDYEYYDVGSVCIAAMDGNGNVYTSGDNLKK